MEPTANLAFCAHDHRQCRATALARAEALADRRGLRLTPVRRRTLEILLEAHQALGAYDVLDRLAEDGFSRQPPVAYRALDFLVEHGLAHRIRRLNAFAACLYPDVPHVPAFLICESCNALAEAPGGGVAEALREAARDVGFEVTRASIEAVGLCPSCREARP